VLYGEARKLMDGALAVGLPPATPFSGQEVDHDAPVAIVSVTDEGMGIANDAAGRIFARFAQVTAHRSSVVGGNCVAQPAGTGLGLNLCVKFVHRMNGNIWVSNSTERGGACFSFYIPVVSEDDTVFQVKQYPGSHSTVSQTDSNFSGLRRCESVSDLRILVVDDTGKWDDLRGVRIASFSSLRDIILTCSSSLRVQWLT